MAISAKDVNELRQTTSMGMMECKKALEEAGGDMAKAIEILQSKAKVKMDAKVDRSALEGRIAASIHPDRSKGALIQLSSETDFTSGSDVFKAMTAAVVAEAVKQAPGDVVANEAITKLIDEIRITTKENVSLKHGKVLGGPGSVVGAYVHFNVKVGVLIELTGGDVSAELLNDLGMHIASVTPTPISVDESGVPAEIVEKEKAAAKAQAIEQGKPEQIAEKMVTGKIRKFYEDNCLIHQLFVKDDKKRIKELLPKGVTIKAFVRYQLGK